MKFAVSKQEKAKDQSDPSWNSNQLNTWAHKCRYYFKMLSLFFIYLPDVVGAFGFELGWFLGGAPELVMATWWFDADCNNFEAVCAAPGFILLWLEPGWLCLLRCWPVGLFSGLESCAWWGLLQLSKWGSPLCLFDA